MNEDAVDDVTIHLPNAPTTAGSARRIVGDHLADHPRCHDLMVCVSEIVTNAIVHARSAPTMRLTSRMGRIRVEVADRDPALPVMQPPSMLASGGRGLRIVDHLSLDWGVTPGHRGKVVWFEFEDTPGDEKRARAPAPSPTVASPRWPIGGPGQLDW
jgi:anti-sigma regulatory factor (Ser/Thr protein kinase)